ncbi:MAG: N-acetylmuramoyl-L-alanine amidase family protein [Acetobacteraceae bacterium]
MLLPRRRLLRHGLRAGLAAPLLLPRRAARAERLRRVMLDPGHGGIDPGALGLDGTVEKVINLATALDLRSRLLATRRYAVGMTRTTDVFVSLGQRVALAQKFDADIFMSMHANIYSNPAIRGGSAYTLSAHASDALAAAMARDENREDRVVGPKLPPVSSQVAGILVSLVKHETMLGSARLAEHVVAALGRVEALLVDPWRQADFAVLQSVSIPSTLVEMGFLSNPIDAANFQKPAFRATIAGALASAIDSWFATGGLARVAG